MTPVAFYAPMKPPTHPVASGDRTMAQGLMRALDHGGYRAGLASDFQSRDGKGCTDTQIAVIAAAEREAEQLVAKGRRAGWQAWVTYHNYYKAPDLLGPVVSRALSIPYVLIEATRARKRLGGPWDLFARKAEAASDTAHTICYLTARDAEALRAYAPAGQKLVHLRPFLAITELPDASDCTGPLLSVGMLREGDKLASYDLVAQSLGRVRHSDWQMQIVGDGPARVQIERMMAPFGTRVSFAGALSGSELQKAYTRAGLFFWPGVNEAFGMTYLEAQAAGLAVVAQDRPGVRDVLAPGDYPAQSDGAQALADMLDLYLADTAHRLEHGRQARAHIAEHHLLPAAARTLSGVLRDAIA
ncbi:glycosyltransferase family 4 protein [uncultured Roseobacter sp.]|uniref:glycosyltransferase family 4 protein n=1 Tax=uncultured Roseobacter sp. TaxID=114847 RepID=UPI0026192E88|nr:glycosyltransferase family 4 protein [uncultured Roseobacter sp.]